MYIVKEQKSGKIAAIFKDKEKATDYVTISRIVENLSLYIINEPMITEEVYDVIYDIALIDCLIDPNIITDRIPETVLKMIAIMGGTKK